MQGVFNAGFLLFHFNFSRCANLDNGNAAGQFRYALLQFFTIVVRGRFFDLLTNLSNAALDGRFVAHAIDDDGGVFVDHNAFCLAQVFQGGFFQLQTDLFRDNGTGSQGRDILQHGFTAVAEARRLNGSHFHDAAHGVDHQGRQRFAFNVFSDDQQRFACFGNGFQHRQHFADVGDLFVGQQDERAFQLNRTGFRLVDEVWGQVTAVELHTFNHVQLVLQAGAFFNGDNAFFAHFLHRFRDQFTHGFVGVGGDGAYLSDSFGIGARYGQFLQFFNRGDNRFVDAALQIHRVHACSNRFQAFGDDGLRQYGCSGGAVARRVVRFGGHFFHHLCTHVLELVFQFDFTRNGNAVFGDGRCAERFIQHYVAAFRAQGHFYCISENIHAAEHFHASVIAEFYVFSCHWYFPSTRSVQKIKRNYASTIARMSLSDMINTSSLSIFSAFTP